MNEESRNRFLTRSKAIAAIRPGPYGVELVLDGVNSQLLAQYDETLANSSRAEHAMELFL